MKDEVADTIGATDGEQARFLQAYGDYMRTVLKPTRKRLRHFLDEWEDERFWGTYAAPKSLVYPAPVHAASVRIKRPESVVDKILRKPASFPQGLNVNSVRQMNDALGARIVVYFLSDLKFVDKALREHPDLELRRDDPPIAYLSRESLDRLGLSFERREDKESGYTSLHYVMRFVDKIQGPSGGWPWMEIQVRTVLEDAWAVLEHVLGYKAVGHPTFYAQKQLEIQAGQQRLFDEQFDLLREELETRIKDAKAVAGGERLSALNFPSLLQEAGLMLGQDEIGLSLKLLASRGIATAGQFRSLWRQNWKNQIRSMYFQEWGEQPTDLEVVAAMANLYGAKTPEEITERIRAQIDYDRFARKHQLDRDRPSHGKSRTHGSIPE